MKLRITRRFVAAQRGASLLESIAFLGIAAIVVAGAVALLTSSFGSANSGRAEQEVASIRVAVKRLYMGQSASYGTGSLNGTLINAKAIPTSLGVNGTNLSNVWNGAVTVTGATGTFLISYAEVPKDACISMVSAGGDWLTIGVNGTDLALPATPSAAETACNAAANTVVFTAS
jgi:type II secretory pathway pseudopilin PulG